MPIILESAGVIHDDMFEPWELVTHCQYFVGLFLIFHDDEARLGMLQDEFDLVGEAIDENAKRDGPRRLRRQLRIEPFRSVPGDHRHSIAAPQAEIYQSQAERAHVLVVLLPGHFLPDPVLLFAQRHLTRAILTRLGHQQSRNRTLIHAGPFLAYATSNSSPRYALITSGSCCTSEGSPSAIFLPKSNTATRSEISITTPMSCSIITAVSCLTRLMYRIKRTMSSVSSAFMPAVGSSRSSRVGSRASARANSTRFCRP